MFSFRSCFLNLCTIDILGLIILCCRVEADGGGSILCIVDCLPGTLASSRWMSAAFSQASSDVLGRGWYQNCPWLRTTAFDIENMLAKQSYLIVKITKIPYELNINVFFQLLIRYGKFECNQTHCKYNTYNVRGVK